MNKKLLSPKQAADSVPVSVSLIYQWCDEGRLPHYRLGGHGRRGKIMIDPDDLAAFMSSCRITEPPDDDGELEHIR